MFDPETVDIEQSKKDGYFTGQLLIAMPQLRDSFFARSLVYICLHNADGAMGLVLNKALPSLTFRELLLQLKIEKAQESVLNNRVHFGGPVETARGFVLHTPDYKGEGTIKIDEALALSTSVEVLKDIAGNQGPESSFVALGYAGWTAGQLDSEMLSNGWLSVEPDHDLLFGTDLEGKWQRAMSKLGIDLEALAVESGEA